VDDGYPCSAVTPGGERMYFEDLLTEGQRVGPADSDENVYLDAVVVRRDDGLWIEAISEGER
jgi:hypothetical protein